MQTQDQTTIDVKREISASPETVFEAIRKGALFTSTGIKDGSLKMDFREGGTYVLDWKSGGHCEGRFTQIIPNKTVVFTWHSSGCKSGTEKDTFVNVTLSG